MAERRCISVQGATYAQIQDYCRAHGISHAEFVTRVVRRFFEGPEPEPEPSPIPAGAPDVPPASSQW